MGISNYIAAAVVAFCAMGGAAQASTVSLDFESFGGFYDADFDFGGVSFQAGEPGQQMQVGSFGANGPGQSGNTLRAAVPPFGGFPRGGAFGGTFLGSTVSALSLVAGDSGGDLDIFNLQAFDASGNLLDETGEVSGNSAVALSVSGSGIASFFLSIGDRPDNNGSSFVDNVSFTQEVAPVPLPASLALLGAGVLGLGLVARRRRKTAF
ncbi:PEP-CTERM sorting domain-containing protein [Gymnodinialimonas ulvae]|uniref:PEP-CTERM sorting domain-containing protein n=1 Tax=Gymnodinialimonas ulvae TaxID=3126504 RepID=UPI0030AF2330